MDKPTQFAGFFRLHIRLRYLHVSFLSRFSYFAMIPGVIRVSYVRTCLFVLDFAFEYFVIFHACLVFFFFYQARSTAAP